MAMLLRAIAIVVGSTVLAWITTWFIFSIPKISHWLDKVTPPWLLPF